MTVDYMKTFMVSVKDADENTPFIAIPMQPWGTTGKLRVPLMRNHQNLRINYQWKGFITSLHFQGTLMDRNQRA